MRVIVLLAALLGSAADAQQPLAPMSLECVGGGSANKSRSGTVSAWNNNGGYAGGTVVTQDSVGFQDQVNLIINGSDDRIRMPRTMLPTIHGGEKGWFKLKNVEFTDGEIRASAAINPINNPKVRLDRYTGAISISGRAGDFVGQCRKYDPASEQRQF